MSSRLLSTTAEEVLPRNRMRVSWLIQNEDLAIDVYVKRERAATPTCSATDHDFAILAGGNLALNTNLDGKEAIQDRWTIVAASGTPRVAFFETENIVR